MKKKTAIFTSICLLIGLGVFIFLKSTSGKYYHTFSPDKQYSVYASKNNSALFSMQMFGNSGDASGKVFLYDEIEKKIINSAPISMVSMAANIRWNENKAYFVHGEYPTSIEPWKLPRPIVEPKQTAIDITEEPEEKIKTDIIDLDIYILSTYSKDKTRDGYIPFTPLTDWFEFKDHKDSTVIADKYLAEGNRESYHTLNAKYRNRFLKQKNISENDSVFVYNYVKDKILTFLVQDLPLLAHITVYESETVVPQYYYLIGFDFDNLLAVENCNSSYIYIGKKNPFNLGAVKPFKWGETNKIPVQISKKDTRTVQIDLAQVYTFLDNEMEFFYFPGLEKIFVLNAQSKEIIYTKKFFVGEGASLSPLNYMDKNFPNESHQWTGKLFKDYPPVLFGFTWQSFGCGGIDIIQQPSTMIPILCDNRH